MTPPRRRWIALIDRGCDCSPRFLLRRRDDDGCVALAVDNPGRARILAEVRAERHRVPFFHVIANDNPKRTGRRD
jgi:hypothetical protein